jgi:hypothetical protein
MVKCVDSKVSGGSVLGGRIAKRRERAENSDAIKQFRRMRLLSEMRAAHRKMEEPKTLEQLLADEARAQLDKARGFFAGATLPL